MDINSAIAIAKTVSPILAAAGVAGVVSLWVGRSNRKAASEDVKTMIAAESVQTDRKLAQERDQTDRKLSHDREKSVTDRAWIDYSLRRDIYLELAARVSSLFDQTLTTDTVERAKMRAAFMETTRKVRLIGSDEVVDALNALTKSIKSGSATTNNDYGRLMNAIRVDIRTLNEKPPVGTKLDGSAFPIES